jgi:uncharacterized integral membrane protein
MTATFLFLALGVVAVGVLVLFIAQNTGSETVHFLFFSWQVAIWQPPVVVGIIAVGLLIAYFGTHHLRMAARTRELKADLAERDRTVAELNRRIAGLKSIDASSPTPPRPEASC